MMVKIALANVGAENGLSPNARLPGETGDLAAHLPGFKTITQFAAQGKFKKRLEGGNSPL